MNKKTYKVITKVDSITMPDLWYVCCIYWIHFSFTLKTG